MTSFDVQVRLAILRAFIDGRPTPTVERIAADLRATTQDVASAFDRLADGHVLVLAPDSRDVVMSAPFAAGATDFAVQVGARRHHANCIWDALGISAMLGGESGPLDTDVLAHCADCEEPLALAVRDGAVTATPSAAVAHFAVPAARWWEDIAFT